MLICSPEYAHGVSGAMNNALDWLVSGPEIIGMPVAAINASPQATHAQDSLLETLNVMSTAVVREACITLPLAGRKLDAEGLAADRELSGALRAAVVSLAAAAPSARRFVDAPNGPETTVRVLRHPSHTGGRRHRGSAGSEVVQKSRTVRGSPPHPPSAPSPPL